MRVGTAPGPTAPATRYPYPQDGAHARAAAVAAVRRRVRTRAKGIGAAGNRDTAAQRGAYGAGASRAALVHTAAAAKAAAGAAHGKVRKVLWTGRVSLWAAASLCSVPALFRIVPLK